MGVTNYLLSGMILQVQMEWNTPLKINMEHNHGGVEDHFPFYMGDL